jgi:hypothetical protein
LFIFLLKLILVPLLIGGVSLAGRAWGAAVGGWLASLPIVAGPIVLLLALEHGPTFAAEAAHNTMIGLVSLLAFCLVYSWLALRSGWLGSLLAGWSTFLLFTILLSQLRLPLTLSFIGVVGLFGLILKLFPQPPGQGAPAKPLRFEIIWRMAAAAVLVTTLTSVANSFGPRLSGLLTPFPVIATILAVFTHHGQGGVAAVWLLRGLVAGLLTFAVFFFVVAWTVEAYGLLPAFLSATIIGLLAHGLALLYLKGEVLADSRLLGKAKAEAKN